MYKHINRINTSSIINIKTFYYFNVNHKKTSYEKSSKPS